MLNSIMNFILPKVCIICKKFISDKNIPLCNECFKKIKFINSNYCVKCGIVLNYGGEHCYECLKSNRKKFYEYLRSVCVYDGVIKDIIHLFKYSNKEYLYTFLGDLMVEYIKKEQNFLNVDLIVPVPLHWYKKFQRSYNQSDLLTKYIAKKLNMKFELNNLYRKKFTKSQTKLNREKRIKNVRGVFDIKNPDEFDKRKILLIDDVTTTGATLNECAWILKKAGASKIYGLTLARDCYTVNF